MGRKCKVLLRDSGRDCCLPAWQEHYSISGICNLNRSPPISTTNRSLGHATVTLVLLGVLLLFLLFSDENLLVVLKTILILNIVE